MYFSGIKSLAFSLGFARPHPPRIKIPWRGINPYTCKGGRAKEMGEDPNSICKGEFLILGGDCVPISIKP